MADVCTDLDDVLLFAGVVRALVRTLGQRVLAGVRPPAVNDAVLRAARWRAARYGVTGDLWDPNGRELVSATRAVEGLLAEISPSLQHFGDEALVRDLAARLLDGGASAQRQRDCYAASGELVAVIRDAVELTVRG
jgi:carboxylate-amine ligase